MPAAGQARSDGGAGPRLRPRRDVRRVDPDGNVWQLQEIT
jgi:hypothetical protein